MTRGETLMHALLEALSAAPAAAAPMPALDPEAPGAAPGATLHLSAGRPPQQRHPAGLAPLPGWEPLSDEVLRAVLAALLGDALWSQFERQREGDFAITLDSGARVTGCVFEHDGGIAATLRLQRLTRPLALDELGAPAAVAELGQARAGLVVVSGPTGAGKSTTLAALIGSVNEGPCRHLLLLGEDAPLTTAARRPVLTSRALGGAGAVDSALRAAARQGVDVLVVDPLPDVALVPRLCEIAGAGVLVLISLRAGSSAVAAAQLLASFAVESAGRAALSPALRGIIHQRLCRGVGGGACAAFEVVLDGPGMLAALRDPEALPPYLAQGRRRGMQSLSEGLRRLHGAGLISEEELHRQSAERRRFQVPSLQEL